MNKKSAVMPTSLATLFLLNMIGSVSIENELNQPQKNESSKKTAKVEKKIS